MTPAACTAAALQPVINALGVLLVAAAPGVAALLVALSNRGSIAKLPLKRSTDVVQSVGNGANGGPTNGHP